MRISDIRGALRLAVQATRGVTRITEGVHQSVWKTLGAPGGKTAGTTRGITGGVYRLVEGITQITGKSADTVMAVLQTTFESADRNEPRSARAESILAVLNGVMGDRLAEDASPFAITMDIRSEAIMHGGTVEPAAHGTAGKILLLIHGLCMDDLKQHAQHNGYVTEPGELLADRLGYFPLYLRYNSGLHISQNGKELSGQLQQLVDRWPEEIADLSAVAHSMGGLVIRSAIQQAQQQGMSWPEQLKNLVFLGTPHHGAPLERAGNWLDLVLEHAPYVKPFAALGQLRSAGITDLRYGNLLAQDWDSHDRFELKPDKREIVPLPDSVNCFTVAATLAEKRSILSDRLLGDGLVPLHSALGQHDEPERNLVFPESSRRIVYKTGHMELLHSPEVNDQIISWLAAVKPAQNGS